CAYAVGRKEERPGQVQASNLIGPPVLRRDDYFTSRESMTVPVGIFPGAPSAFAFDRDEGQVRWDGIAGVVTALNLDNPVGNIDSGTFAWTARGGRVRVNLATGASAFAVDGLVINGTIFSGTPGPVTAVTGILVCNPGD